MSENKFLFVKSVFTNPNNRWENGLKNVPAFDISKLKKYLVESRDKSFDKESVRAYKSLKAFKYFEEGFVQRLSHIEKTVENTSLYLISSRVLASYQGKSYQIYVTF